MEIKPIAIDLIRIDAGFNEAMTFRSWKCYEANRIAAEAMTLQ